MLKCSKVFRQERKKLARFGLKNRLRENSQRENRPICGGYLLPHSCFCFFITPTTNTIFNNKYDLNFIPFSSIDIHSSFMRSVGKGHDYVYQVIIIILHYFDIYQYKC